MSRKQLIVCDKCLEVVTTAAFTLVLPCPGQSPPQRQVDLCEQHAEELLRWFTQPSLSIPELEREGLELRSQVLRLSEQLQELHADASRPTEPPQGYTPQTEPPEHWIANAVLPDRAGLLVPEVLAGLPAFPAGPPPEPDSPGHGSPLAFTHQERP